MKKRSLTEWVSAIVRHVPPLLHFLSTPSVRNRLKNWSLFQSLYSQGVLLTHPFDQQFKTNTSGSEKFKDARGKEADIPEINVCMSSQPSIIRYALKSLPLDDSFTFLDIGCGKGRALIVASEFSFRDIIGVELSPYFAEISRKNSAVIQRQNPRECPIRIEVCDATNYKIPEGNCVIYLFNPFNEDLFKKLLANVEKSLHENQRRIFIVYYNPIFGHCLDASPLFRRFFAQNIPYAKDEIGYGPDESDAVVIWQAGEEQPIHGADRKLWMTKKGLRCEVREFDSLRA